MTCSRRTPSPDLVIYLQAPTDVLMRRLRERARDLDRETIDPDPRYLKELNEAYQHFFFHYSAPRCWSWKHQLDLAGSDEALDDLLKQIRAMGRGSTTSPELAGSW